MARQSSVYSPATTTRAPFVWNTFLLISFDIALWGFASLNVMENISLVVSIVSQDCIDGMDKQWLEEQAFKKLKRTQTHWINMMFWWYCHINFDLHFNWLRISNKCVDWITSIQIHKLRMQGHLVDI